MSHVTATPSSLDPTNPNARTAAASDGSELVSRVAQGVHETVDRLAETATPAVQKLEATMAHASETMNDQMHRARELGDEWSDSLRGTVREHPLASLMVALAAGVLISRLGR